MKKRKDILHKSGREDFRKYFFWAVILGLVVLSYLILRPYIIALISAFILSYLIRPVCSRLEGRLGKSLSAVISIFLVVVVLVVPFVLVIGGAVQQAYIYAATDSLEEIIQGVLHSQFLENLGIDNLTERGVSTLANLLTSAASHVPSILISFFVTVFGMYYILINWDNLANTLRDYIPFGDKEEVSADISKVTNIMVYGTLFIAIIEFFVATIGFYIAGVSFYLLLASLIFFFAFIPGLGPTAIWVPLALYYFLTKNYFGFVGVVITGLLLSLGIDALLRGKVLGDRAKLNPLLAIVGVLGGIAVFGVFGFIIGPLVLIYAIKLLEEGLKQD